MTSGKTVFSTNGITTEILADKSHAGLIGLLTVQDGQHNLSVKVNYDNPVAQEDLYVPSVIRMEGKTSKTVRNLTVKAQKMSFNVKKQINFAIPSNYKKKSLDF